MAARGDALLIRRRRPIGEPAGDAATLDGTRGAGRIVAALGELGIDLGTVRQLIVEAGADAPEIDRLDLGQTFDLVVLGSHLVNRPEEGVGGALLAVARRHLAPNGLLLLEHHPIDWAETAAEVRPTPGGGRLGMVDVRRDPPFVSAVSVYDVRGRVVRQPFTARVLTEAELVAALKSVGLKVTRRLRPTWLLAVRAQG
ncbi:MAG: class I SAM-dependent methyltransferase [Chloroflexi bacterium]|nr:class I SAM-dependent methyltransferase [Chloroflexota bacterium]